MGVIFVHYPQEEHVEVWYIAVLQWTSEPSFINFEHDTGQKFYMHLSNCMQ